MLKDYIICQKLIKGLNKELGTTVDMTIYTENVIVGTQELLDHLGRNAAWNNTFRDMETLMEININPHAWRSGQSTLEEWTKAQDTAHKFIALSIMINVWAFSALPSTVMGKRAMCISRTTRV